MISLPARRGSADKVARIGRRAQPWLWKTTAASPNGPDRSGEALDQFERGALALIEQPCLVPSDFAQVVYLGKQAGSRRSCRSDEAAEGLVIVMAWLLRDAVGLHAIGPLKAGKFVDRSQVDRLIA
ncbi:hypothetical protein V1290_002515 [Bradyrhizobium sp. AZCC 1578]|uniref:hypothetical protein n=1 Tax=Bradyrhizobium sp. AZCC 1578 TaxID=3117027 RepID=UPI002FEF12B8